MKTDAIIVGYSNISSEGITLHLNTKTALRSGNIQNNQFWVSWDKIGPLLFDGYTEKMEVDERNKLREAYASQFKHPAMPTGEEIVYRKVRVKERLPDKDGIYFCLRESLDNKTEVAYYLGLNKSFVDKADGKIFPISMSYYTHWLEEVSLSTSREKEAVALLEYVRNRHPEHNLVAIHERKWCIQHEGDTYLATSNELFDLFLKANKKAVKINDHVPSELETKLWNILESYGVNPMTVVKCTYEILSVTNNFDINSVE